MRLSSHFLLPVKYCPTPDSTEYQVDILYFLHIWLVTCRTRAPYTICVIIYFSPLLSVCRWDVTDNQNQILVRHVRRNRHKRQAVSPARARGCGIKHFDRRTGVLRPPRGDLRLPEDDVQPAFQLPLQPENYQKYHESRPNAGSLAGY